MWLKEKLLVLSNFFFCHYVFKKPSAAEASESVYMRERVNIMRKEKLIMVSSMFSFSQNIYKKLSAADVSNYVEFRYIIKIKENPECGTD